MPFSECFNACAADERIIMDPLTSAVEWTFKEAVGHVDLAGVYGVSDRPCHPNDTRQIDIGRRDL